MKKATLDKSKPSIEVLNYTKTFKKFVAADDMNFSVNHGVIHGFIGPNGSGKTTAIKAMIGAYIPTKGKIMINGHKAGSQLANSLIGYIPERASFPSHLNTIQYLSLMGELSGIKAKDSKKTAYKILEDLGLEKHARRKPIGFSSGMQKKILLAQSLLTNPSILILDEPAANLDPTARKDLFDQLIKLRDEGKTILISSHILAELERIIDEVTFVYYGDLMYSGDIHSLENDKSDVFVKSSNNKLLCKKVLEKKNYKIAGDLKTEIIFCNLSQKEIKSLFLYLSTLKDLAIRSFRANDLQAIYDKLVKDAELNKRGKQTIDGKKVIAMKESHSTDKEVEEIKKEVKSGSSKAPVKKKTTSSTKKRVIKPLNAKSKKASKVPTKDSKATKKKAATKKIVTKKKVTKTKAVKKGGKK